MTIEEFIKKYRIASKGRESGELFLQERITRLYVPYVQKVAVCNNIVNTCWYVEDELTNSKRLHINSTNLYLFYIMWLIHLYTDIQFEDSKVADAYDCLNQYHVSDNETLIQVIIDRIPNTQRAQFNSILQMVESDIEKNEYQIGAWLSNRIENCSAIIGNSILPILNSTGLSLDDIKNMISGINQ